MYIILQIVSFLSTYYVISKPKLMPLYVFKVHDNTAV